LSSWFAPWKPIFYVLEDAFTCVLANAAQIAQVPGRKTDVKDCVWIAQLLEHGPSIDEVTITAHPGQDLVPLPEGASYPGFIFARAESPERVEAALREAHRRLEFVVMAPRKPSEAV